MMKRFILLTATLLTIWFYSAATIPPGSWRMIPSFIPRPESVVETPEGVYYLAGGSLFFIDKENDGNMALTTDNGLSDHTLTLIRYNPSKGYLFAGYDNGNIDLIYDSGDIVNLPDIRDASASPKTINDIAFSGDNIYVATGAGLIKFSTSKNAVADYGLYGKSVDGVAVAGSRLIISIDNSLLAVEEGSRINSISLFSSLGDWTPSIELLAVTPTLLLARHDTGVGVYEITPGGWVAGSDRTPSPSLGQISLTADGKAVFSDGEMLYIVAPGGDISSLPLPDNLRSNVIGTFTGEESLWGLDGEGIINMVSSGGASWTTAMQRFRPEALAVKEAAFIIPGAVPEHVYFTNLGPTVYRMGISDYTDGHDVEQQAAMIAHNYLSSLTLTPPLKSPTRLAEDPADPSMVYMGSGNEGISRVADGKVTGVYSASNAPLSGEWGSTVFELSFDNGGNLWVAGNGIDNQDIIILPADKLRLDPAAVSAADWIIPSIPDHDLNMDIRIFHCRQSPMTFIFDTGDSNLLIAYHNGGTPSTFSDDRVMVWKSFTDQDGREFTPHRCTSIAEDRNGRVWIGTSGGVMEISNPEKAIDPSMTVRRLKIAHNDGTSLADYLVETDVVLDISVDGANRKWLATGASGLYLVNDEGNEIISRFTAANSPLPADRVNAVYCDALANTVYVATPCGVMEYGGTAAPPAGNYSSLHIYPNPVTPDFTGEVTVEGLTEGSLVKIADSSGAVVWQGRAEGGMVRWPAQTSAGRRVASGVYYLLPSPAESTVQAAPVVAKILVVN